jgi:hypothetical protein
MMKEKHMLKKDYVRDGEGRTIGSVTSGLAGDSTVVRDEKERVVGTTSGKFNVTRDEHGGLVSGNSSDPGLLFRKK